MLPYYVGKVPTSCGLPLSRVRLRSPAARILIQHWDSEAEAFEMEKWYIAFYGRKDIGTGLLLNQDEGGRAPSHATSSKGGKISGRNRVASGQWERIRALFTPEDRSKVSRITGRRNAETGHLQRIAASGGLISGRRNVESGEFDRIRRSDLGGRVGGPIGMHNRWHVNRDIVKEGCELCIRKS